MLETNFYIVNEASFQFCFLVIQTNKKVLFNQTVLTNKECLPFLSWCEFWLSVNMMSTIGIL